MSSTRMIFYFEDLLHSYLHSSTPLFPLIPHLVYIYLVLSPSIETELSYSFIFRWQCFQPVKTATAWEWHNIYVYIVYIYIYITVSCYIDICLIFRFGFIPRTYVLPQDSKLLRQAWEKSCGKEKWIIKPVWGIPFSMCISEYAVDTK